MLGKPAKRREQGANGDNDGEANQANKIKRSSKAI